MAKRPGKPATASAKGAAPSGGAAVAATNASAATETAASLKIDSPARSAPMSESPQDRNVDQIRDILFGGQMRDYERRFQDLAERVESESARLRQDLDKRLAQIEKRFDEQIEKLVKSQRQEVSDRTQSVDDLESRVLQAQRASRRELQGGLQALEAEVATRDERLREELAELRQLLAERATELAAQQARADQDVRADKVGRAVLAALLTEVALRLKGEFELPLPRR
jgi:exonuclease VII large subunit